MCFLSLGKSFWLMVAHYLLLPAIGHGRVELSKYLYLDDVLLVSSLPINLLSVQRLCSSLNCTAHFTKSGCVFQVVAPQMETGRGYSSRGLYYLVLNNPASTPYAAQSSQLTAHQWHSKLGHPSLPKLQVMIPSLKSSSRSDCKSCQLSKQPRASFPISVFFGSSKPFDLVHSDVWGPVSVTNYYKFKYYLLFIDNFTRMTWLYLIHVRSEVLTCFEQFLHEIQTQFSIII